MEMVIYEVLFILLLPLCRRLTTYPSLHTSLSKDLEYPEIINECDHDSSSTMALFIGVDPLILITLYYKHGASDSMNYDTRLDFLSTSKFAMGILKFSESDTLFFP